jgi:hypothetical protein
MLLNPQQQQKPTFILGMGAQKAGTSWLHRELSRCHQINLGFRKEYNAFPTRQSNLKKASRRLLRSQNSFDRVGFEDLPDSCKLDWMRKDSRYYLYYFENLLRANSELNATGDLSPHYGELTQHEMFRVRHLLEGGGFKVKVIFLLRDPVERIWSQLRMLRNQNRFPELCGYRNEETALAMVYTNPRFSAKTQYHQTLESLEKCFQKSQIHVEFYEDLFTSAAHKRLCDFLELDLPSPQFEVRVNSLQKQSELCPMLQRKIAVAYREVYEAMITRFGSKTLKLWPNAQIIHENPTPARKGWAKVLPW